MKKINWTNIQNFYDEGHSWNDILNHFKISRSTLYRASKNDIFKSRSKTDAINIYYENHEKAHSKETRNKISKSIKNYHNNLKVNKIIYLWYISDIFSVEPYNYNIQNFSPDICYDYFDLV